MSYLPNKNNLKKKKKNWPYLSLRDSDMTCPFISDDSLPELINSPNDALLTWLGLVCCCIGWW